MDRPTIVLPSGARCRIRRLQMMDYALGAGDLSIIDLQQLEKSVAQTDKTPDVEALKSQMKMAKVILLRCTGPLIFPGGLKRKIVDKPFYECADDEMAVEEVSDADAIEILNQVNALSTVSKEVAAQAAAFPSQATNGRSGASDSKVVRETAVGPPTT